MTTIQTKYTQQDQFDTGLLHVLRCLLGIGIIGMAFIVYLNPASAQPKEIVCMNSVKYELKNTYEFHIILNKGVAIPCKEEVSDPM